MLRTNISIIFLIFLSLRDKPIVEISNFLQNIYRLSLQYNVVPICNDQLHICNYVWAKHNNYNKT